MYDTSFKINSKMTMINIYTISNMYPSLDNPGYGVFVKNIIVGLNKEGVKTRCMSVISGRGNNVFSKIFKYIIFYCSICFHYFKKYDYIYVHFPTYSAPILYILMHINKKKLIINYHGEDLLYQNESWLQQKLGVISDKLTRKFANIVVVPSTYYKRITLSRCLAKVENIIVSPSGGIDCNVFYSKRNRVMKDYFHLGYVGRLEELKGILEFIDACVLISKKYKIKVTIIGYGPLNEIVKEKTKQYSFFEIIYGIIQTQLTNYYNNFDLFYFPSKRKTESLGLVGIEAMACGTPVVGSNIGGITSYLKHKKNGYISDVNNLINDMVKYTEQYINLSTIEKHNMTENCIKTSLSYHNDVVCKNLALVFENFKS